MALDDDVTDNEINTDDEVDENVDTGNTPLTNVNPNAPDFVKDIKGKSSSRLANIDLNKPPAEPSYTSGSEIDDGLKQTSPFLATAKAEAYDFNNTAELAHAGYGAFKEYNIQQDDPLPEGWTPKADEQNFANVRPDKLAYVLDATGPKDQAYRLDRIYQEQAHDDTLANGSFVAKLLGGATGVVTDPTSYIPIVGWAKYGKVGEGILKNSLRALPGAAAYGTTAGAAKETDLSTGNMTDFLTDSFVNTAFGTALFGVGGAVALTADKMELWSLRSATKNYIDGIDYKLHTDSEGIVKGYTAIDTTGNLSAAKVDFAQKLADSSFSKSGLFKVPYLNDFLIKTAGLPVFGSPLVNLLNSPFKTVRGIIDRVADHSIVTEGALKGQAAPPKFASLMNQTMSELRALSVQMTAFHTERNGFNIDNRHLNSLMNVGLNLKDKAFGAFANDIDKPGFVSRDDFNSEVQEAISSGVASSHAPVNKAATMISNIKDKYYGNFRKAYNLPDDWLPPRTQEGFVTRVYDTPYLNNNEDQWVKSISGWLGEADNTITDRMQPINDLSQSIKDFEQKHKSAVEMLANIDNKKVTGTAPNPNLKGIERGVTFTEGEPQVQAPTTTTELQPGSPEHTLHNMRLKLKAQKEMLQNELRSNEDYNLHVEDLSKLSATEGEALKNLLAPRDDLAKQVEDQKQVIREAKAKASQKLSAAKNAKTVEKAIPKSKKYVETKNEVQPHEEKLRELQDKLDQENDRLQDMAHKGEINPRYFTQEPGSFHYEFKDPNDRLKFRDVYEDQAARETHAKAYYDTILNQTPEDTINQVMGRLTGAGRENPLKARTLLIPDKVLYDNNFLTKDIMAKTANYVSYMAKKTHLKNVFNDVTFDGGFAAILSQLDNEYKSFREPLNENKTALQEKLNEPNVTPEEKKQIEGKIADIDKEYGKKRKQLETAKSQLTHLYEKMMGIQKTSRQAQNIKASIMSITSWANLPFVPLTQVNDLTAIGLQHGIWPFVRDGLVPFLTSLGGMLKTKDSQALRETAPSIHLALQDVQMGYADRNWGSQTNPYLNLGKIANTLKHVAHLSSNLTLTNYIDNALQRMSASTFQSNLMRILHNFKVGTMSKRDGLYIRKYGIDPDKWADRMIAAFKQDGGGKTKLGGYQSLFHQWQDMEAANEFGNAVYNSVKDTNINASIADSPFWTDDNGPIGIMGAFLKGFNGWGYASVNRYVIPSLQAPDAHKLLGVMFMLSSGAAIDPMRRIFRGEDPYPPNITPEQQMWSAFNNSGYFSFFANVMQDANLLTGNELMGNLKNDKYKDRTRAGLLGPTWGTVNNMADVVSAIGSREWNKSDANKAARMIPIANSSWGYWMSKKLIDSLDIPQNRAQAHALKEANQ